MLTLLAFVALVALSSADISGYDPPKGSCLCVDTWRANVRLAACGRTKIGQASTGHCFKYRGEKSNCTLDDGNNYVFYKVTIGYNAGWISGGFLLFGTARKCQERPDDPAPPATLFGCPTTISRADWVARDARLVTNINHPVPKVILYHASTALCDIRGNCEYRLRELQDSAIDSERKNDIVYNFAVGSDTNAYEGVGWDRVGERPDNWTSVSIGIGIIGDFSTSPPSDDILDTVKQLITCGVSNGKIAEDYTLHEYCDIICGECPDVPLYNVAKTLPHYGGKLPGSC